jgi:hypothetical protein
MTEPVKKRQDPRWIKGTVGLERDDHSRTGGRAWVLEGSVVTGPYLQRKSKSKLVLRAFTHSFRV